MNKANTISDIGGVIKQESNKYVVYTLKGTPPSHTMSWFIPLL